MAGRLRQEIRQTKPFQSPEQEAHLNLIRTTEEIGQIVASAVKPHGVSMTQYNALRILRGAGAAGLKCGEVGDRMIARDPDMTRLIDRLERQRLVSRQRSDEDRRVVTVRITETGMKLLGSMDEPLMRAQRAALGHMSQAKLAQLIELLEEARRSPAKKKEEQDR